MEGHQGQVRFRINYLKLQQKLHQKMQTFRRKSTFIFNILYFGSKLPSLSLSLNNKNLYI